MQDFFENPKQYDPSSYYKNLSYVDVFDSNSKWRLAQIIEKEGENLTVSFDGWSSKWNEVTKIKKG